MKCEQAWDIMMGVLDNQADKEETDAVMEHIEQCRDCKRLYFELRWMKSETQKLAAVPPDDLKALILHRVADENHAASIKRLHRIKTVRRAVISAATVAAVISLVFAGGYKMISSMFAEQTPKAVDLVDKRGFSDYASYEPQMTGVNEHDRDTIASEPAEIESLGKDTQILQVSRRRIIQETNQAFANLAVNGKVKEVIYMQASAYPSQPEGELIPGISNMRLYRINNYQDFSANAVGILTCELTESEIRQLGLTNGGEVSLVLISLVQ